MSADVKPLLTSCMALGSSLLETYLPSGDRRPDRESEAEFGRKVEDFFQHAACSKYGYEMFNRYKEQHSSSSSRDENIFTRNGAAAPDLIFHKLDIGATSDVIKTAADDQSPEITNKNLVKLAEIVVENANILSTEPGETDGNVATEFPS